MNSIYNHAIKQSSTLRRDLENFENNITNAPLSLIGSLTATLSQLSKTISDYEESINKQYINDHDLLKKEKNTNKLNTLQTQLREFKTSFQVFKRQRDSELEIQQKQQLFERKPASDNPYSNQDTYHGDDSVAAAQNEQRMRYEDGLMRENHRLRSGNDQLDHILEMASMSYENLVSQNDFLSNIGEKLSNTSVNLRLSGMTLSKIEKKMKEDKFLFYGGCFAVFTIFILILRYLG